MGNIINNNIIDGVHYMVFDPSKNITALVDTDTNVESFELISKKIMEREKTVEQVGFLSYANDSDIKLRMAGGEFCGNATMCAAAYVHMKNKKENVKVNVFSIDNPINVNINSVKDNEWTAEVLMPSATKIENVNFKNGKSYPIVFFSSIAHVIVEIDNFSNIDKNNSELILKQLCGEYNIPSIGMIYYDKNNSKISPLVYVKNIDTMFWENACASGTTAIGMYLYHTNNKEINLNIIQPSGAVLKVYNKNNGIYLSGNVKLISI